jgi:ATP-dependent Lon protease
MEVTVTSGTGKLKAAGGLIGATREVVARAFSHLLSRKVELGVGREVDLSDFHVEVIDLLNNGVEAEVGVALFIACYSCPPQKPRPPSLPRGKLPPLNPRLNLHYN